MDDLRALYESLGMRNAQSYIQSGNVVFETGRKDLRKLSAGLNDAIEQRYGFRADAVLRTLAEMKELLAANPFAARPVDPARNVVIFLAGQLSPVCYVNVSHVRFFGFGPLNGGVRQSFHFSGFKRLSAQAGKIFFIFLGNAPALRAYGKQEPGTRSPEPAPRIPKPRPNAPGKPTPRCRTPEQAGMWRTSYACCVTPVKASNLR